MAWQCMGEEATVKRMAMMVMMAISSSRSSSSRSSIFYGDDGRKHTDVHECVCRAGLPAATTPPTVAIEQT